MNLRELEIQAKALAPVLKGLVDRALSAFRSELAKDLDERDSRLASSVSETVDGLALDAEAVSRQVLQMMDFPAGAAAIDPEDIRRAVADEVSKIPVPVDGTSVTVDDVLPLITEKVAAAVAEIPLPKDGVDVDPEMVRHAIADEVAKLPIPQDGKSITLEDVLPLITETVVAAVAEIPVPKDGADVDPRMVRQAIADEVAKLPTPQDGKSITLEDVAPFIQEHIAEAVALIPAPEPGKDGDSVSVDQVQAMVAEAVAKAMAQVEMPRDGEPGRDALNLEILPEIDQAKFYARGTYAKHLGGLWRSFERTTGLKGWECIVEGIAELRIEQDGERGIKAIAQLSSGAVQETQFAIKSMIYRGVFAPGTYAKGDTVTWGGSLWHCDEATSEKPGELGSKGWTLAAKKGRDGKNGTAGKDLTKGVSIK